ncbi:hypothetical protein PG990_011056 [Apiospora arundinis]
MGNNICPAAPAAPTDAAAAASNAPAASAGHGYIPVYRPSSSSGSAIAPPGGVSTPTEPPGGMKHQWMAQQQSNYGFQQGGVGLNPMAMNQFNVSNNNTVLVGGLSGYVTEDELRSFFQGFGEITYVKAPPGKKCGRDATSKIIDGTGGTIDKGQKKTQIVLVSSSQKIFS